MKCRHCNEEIDEESSFCKHCGKKVEIGDRIDRMAEQIDEMIEQMKENVIIDRLFYEKNPAILKKFRKFAKEKLKLIEKLKKQGKYENFIEECENRFFKEDDKPKKKKKKV
ncbi:MAG: zinc ribbon domain-containing protein [Caldisericia bacterium]|jgi:uncharacterized coiled-coil DUF342 family protein|nr:zinc ribbon domain-containing protein [Caldisericia bacterium]